MSEIGRWLFALGLFASWANSAMHIALADRPLYGMTKRAGEAAATGPATAGPGLRWKRFALLGAPSLGFFALIGAFVHGAHPEIVAAALLVSLAAIRRFEIAQWPGDIVVRLGKYVPAAACLLGWLAADGALQLGGLPPERARALGWNGACGIIAGAYLLAAIAKLRESGLAWTEARHHALMFAERTFTGPRWVRGLRLRVARSRWLTRAAGQVGFWAEIIAVAFVFPPARPAVIGAVVALHFGFMLLLGYFEPEWIIVMIAVAMLAA